MVFTLLSTSFPKFGFNRAVGECKLSTTNLLTYFLAPPSPKSRNVCPTLGGSESGSGCESDSVGEAVLNMMQQHYLPLFMVSALNAVSEFPIIQMEATCMDGCYASAPKLPKCQPQILLVDKILRDSSKIEQLCLQTLNCRHRRQN